MAIHCEPFGRVKTLVRRTVGFARGQTATFRLMLVRRTLHQFALGLTTQYNSIYANLLGADAVQLGSLQSAGNAMGAVASVAAGWLIDYYSPKRVFLAGTAMLVASRFLYFVAPHWAWLFAGVILFYLGMRTTCTCCTFTCATELPNVRRATGRGFCRTLASVVAILAPLAAAALVSLFGDIDSLGGIRPLYALETAVFGGIFVLLLARLRDSGARSVSGGSRLHVVRDFAQVLRRGPRVVRLLLVMGLMELPWAMTQPFVPLYARDFKGANEFVLGGISVAATVVPLLTSIPLGRLADRHGRKKLIFIIAPLAYAANLCLVLAPRTGIAATQFVLLYGVLFGFNSISMALASSMAAEIVSAEQMGRWIGMVNLFRASLAIPAPFVGGLIWEHVGPQYIFFLAIAVDVLMRIPLLASVPETLRPGDGSTPGTDDESEGGAESAQEQTCFT